jgi:hypothetical protein
MIGHFWATMGDVNGSNEASECARALPSQGT